MARPQACRPGCTAATLPLTAVALKTTLWMPGRGDLHEGTRVGAGLLGERTLMFFEEYPIVLLGVIIVVIEVWLRIREPIFHLVARALRRNTPS